MKSLFFYGTLRDADVLRMVLGPESAELTPAILPDHVALAVLDEVFPVIAPAPGQQAQGLLAEGLSAAAIARLNYFELGFGYDLQTMTVQAGARHTQAQVYFCAPGHYKTAQAWDFAQWRATHKALFLEAGAEFMAQFGRLPATALAPLWTGILARATARLAGRATVAPAILRKDHAHEVETLAASRPYVGFFAVEEFRLRHRRFDGSWGPEIDRAVFASGDAVTVLPYDPDADTVLLIEQFRAGPFARQDPNPWCLEVIAGRRDAGETPEQAARRETQEESGLILTHLERIFGYYTTPGCMAEYLTSFVACTDLRGAGGVHGLADEAEDIRTMVVPLDSALETLHSGEANNAPLILSLQWLAANRTRLKNEWARGA